MENNLLARIGARDEVALAELYDHYSGLVYALALRIVGDRDLAREVLQDTFFRCWTEATRYDAARGSVASWLTTLARNRAIDLLRSRSHQARLREGEAMPATENTYATQQLDASDAVVLRQTVQAALHQLPMEQRRAIELAYYGDLTQAEIARHLGQPLGTVKSWTRAGLERLRGSLRPAFDLDGEV